MKKILKLLVITVILLNIIVMYAYAFNTDSYKPDTTWDPSMQEYGGRIVYVFRVVGYGAATILLTYIGIQYMLASPSEKADIKGRAVPYLVGAIMIFCITSLLQIFYNTFSK